MTAARVPLPLFPPHFLPAFAFPPGFPPPLVAAPLVGRGTATGTTLAGPLAGATATRPAKGVGALFSAFSREAGGGGRRGKKIKKSGMN